MPTALSSVPRHADIARRVVLASRLLPRAAPALNPHSATLLGRCPTSRDFVPWRFLDAGPLSVRNVSLLPASKNQHNNGHSAESARCSTEVYRTRKSGVALVFTDGICRNHRPVANVGAFGRHCSSRPPLLSAGLS